MTPYYDDGRGIVIYHGDALELLPELPGSSVDLVLTDPPYMIGAVSSGALASKAGTWGDMMNSSRWFRDWYSMNRRLLRASGAMWSFCNWRSLPVIMKAAIDANWHVESVLVWHKDWIGPGGQVGLRPAYELVALLPREGFAVPDRGIPDVWTHKWSSLKPNGHPAEKPAGLFQRLIETSGGTPGMTVLDPFMGSGTALVAAKSAGLSAIGIETEERWCEVAARRLSQEVLPLVGVA